ASEQIDLPERRDRNLVRLDRDPVGREAGLLGLRLAVRGGNVDAGPTLATRGTEQRPRLLHAGRRNLEVEIAAERALDQRVERRITELRPPRGLDRLLLDDGGIRVMKRGCRGPRRRVVRPHPASAQKKRRPSP